MAQAEITAPDADAPATPPPAAAKKSKLPLILGLVVVLAGGGAGGWFFLKPKASAPAETAEAADGHGEHADAAATGKPNYLELTPPFTVNLSDPDLMRYLQVDLQLVAADADTLKAAESAMPLIRNRLMLLFAQQSYASLLPREGKENLQKQALDEVNRILAAQPGKHQLSALYFTGFIMQ